jgi:hypothetical protein
MKKVVLIVALSMFGVTSAITAPPSGSVVLAQKKGKDEKKNPPGPPVIRDKGNKGNKEKPKEQPPKREKRP